METREGKIDSAGPVKTRRVHYISGFDPRGARHYHRLYREEAPEQSKLNGSVLKVSDRKKLADNISSWRIEGEWKGEAVATEYQFMVWDDIVRRNWDGNLLKLFKRSVPFYFNYLRKGCVGQVLKLSKGAAYTVLYPLTWFLAFLFLALLIPICLGAMGERLTGNFWLGEAVKWPVFFALLWLGPRMAERIDVVWVLRTCVFIYEWGVRPFPDLETRMDEMADWIVAQQKANPVDEVLIVGHSVGSIVGMTVTARILKKYGPDELPPHLNLLTLGQCIPYLSFIGTAKDCRDDLARLGQDLRIPWTDATAPPDPLCFYQVDPIRAEGLPSLSTERPRHLTVRIFRMFSPEKYKLMRNNKRRLHFQYLMASELPAGYDYFQITAGPHRLHGASGAHA